MRSLLALSLAAATAALAGASAGSGASQTRIPSTPPVVVGYNLTAQFEAEFFVSWATKEGDRGASCSTWAEESGTNSVEARTTAPIKGFFQLYRRRTHLIRVGGRNVPVSWGSLHAVGPAKGTVKRTLNQASGVNGGPTCGTPKRFPPSECGQRSFRTRTAALLATWRVFDRTLDPGKANPTGANDPDYLRGLARESIDFHVGPAPDPFRVCPIPSWAHPVLDDVGLQIDDRDWNALRTLRRGQSVALSHHYGGRCSASISPRDCSFRLFLGVTITRRT